MHQSLRHANERRIVRGRKGISLGGYGYGKGEGEGEEEGSIPRGMGAASFCSSCEVREREGARERRGEWRGEEAERVYEGGPMWVRTGGV
jgi:hypothetical protein